MSVFIDNIINKKKNPKVAVGLHSNGYLLRLAQNCQAFHVSPRPKKKKACPQNDVVLGDTRRQKKTQRHRTPKAPNGCLLSSTQAPELPLSPKRAAHARRPQRTAAAAFPPLHEICPAAYSLSSLFFPSSQALQVL